ncbi:sporulation protein rmd1 [Tilletia horrida]|nr:sporulation protein rmd1 [Tilletia horrida]KAK0521282.1 sporulation protein rmd1 [Tilletia horrida]KAK0549648.1 sporulation protein rmd1 [Tilletia horrida]
MAPSLDSRRRFTTSSSGGQGHGGGGTGTGSGSSSSNYAYSAVPRHGGSTGGGGGGSSSSYGASSSLPSYYARGAQPKPKAGPNRSTKASGKLKILPEEPEEGSMTDPPPRPSHGSKHHHVAHRHHPSGRGPTSSLSTSAAPPTHTPIEALRRKPYPYPSARTAADRDGDDEDDDDEEDKSSSEGDDDNVDEAEQDEYRARLYQQLAQIPEGNMRRDARRLTRKARASLPRVTAYSTATSYRMRELTKWLQVRRESHQTNVMTFDECVYTTYSYALVDASRAAAAAAHHYHHHGHGSMRANGGVPHPNSRRPSLAPTITPSSAPKTGDLLGVPELRSHAEAEAVAQASASSSSIASGADKDASGAGPGAGANWEAIAEANDSAAAQVAAEANAQYPTADGATLMGSEREGEGEEKMRSTQESEETSTAVLANRKQSKEDRFSVHGNVPEVFFMEYGTVVIWGMTLAEEKRLLRELKRFEVEKLAPEDIESEDLNWYLADYSRIYNDVITLRRGSSYMTKLSLSHALAQSTKISFFEGVIDNTIDSTKDIPQSIAESGKIGMPPAEIMKQIGHLFILRMNIHLVGSIVDSPEIFWSQPDLEPLYSAARSYLEIPQRIDLLNARVEVLQDMLQLLKDQVTSSHSEWLEIIVIVLIVLEIILGVATMLVDLFFA